MLTLVPAPPHFIIDTVLQGSIDHGNTQRSTYALGILDEARLQQVACYVADSVARNSLDQDSEFFKVFNILQAVADGKRHCLDYQSSKSRPGARAVSALAGISQPKLFRFGKFHQD